MRWHEILYKQALTKYPVEWGCGPLEWQVLVAAKLNRSQLGMCSFRHPRESGDPELEATDQRPGSPLSRG